MRITRRTLLASGAAAGLTATRSWANATIENGPRRLDTLSDGHLVLPGAFLLGDLPLETVKPILEQHELTPEELKPDCNITLVRDGAHTILFDAGSGPDFMPTAGKLSEALDAAGVLPEDVTHVIFTHAHPDHLWGVLDDFGDPFFPEAAHFIGRKEWDYWTSPETVDSIGEARAAFAVGAERRLKAIESQLALFDDGDELVSGVTARASFGHTPGHMCFEVALGDERVLIVGDAIGNHHIAFARPDLPSGADQDPDQGAATRQALLAQLADTQMPFVGFHLPFPGVGRAERAAEGYRFVPMI